MAQAKCLRHLNFYLYFQNSKLDQGNRTFLEIYISVRICDLPGFGPQKGLDKNSGLPADLELQADRHGRLSPHEFRAGLVRLG